MLIREFLKSLTCGRKSDSRRRLQRPHDLSEQLESRTLLTGNVQISLNGTNAQLTGDAAGNEVEIVVENGSIVVRGLNGTTINQETTDFTLATGATELQGSLTGSLGGGDDIITIGSGITLTGNVSVSGDDGADTLRVLGGTLHGNLNLSGDDGVTSIVVDGATISGNLAMSGAGSTLASISNSTVHGRLDVHTGDSADSIVIQSTTVDGVTAIHTGRGDDNVVLQNSTLHGRLWVETGAGNDVVYINSSNVGESARIAMRRGNDTVQVLGGSNFDGRLVVAGGAGHDGANIDSNTSARRVAKRSQKAKYFDASLISSRITDSTTGAIARANALLAAAVPTLTLATSPGTFSEDAGATASTLTVTRTGPTTAAQIVTLTSSNTSKATVPATVTIPAGSTSITTPIAAIDNTVIDGTATVTITAAATGFANVTTTLTVTDNDVAALTVAASPATFSESAGTTASTLTVTRTGPTTAAQIVTLTSSNTSKATVPATVTIPAGSTSVTTPIAAIDNSVADGTATVTITAAATGFANVTTTLTVTDNEPALTLAASPATFSENAGTTASTLTVTRTGPTTAAQTVTLTSSNTSKATVPATVTIPLGSSSVTTQITAIDNTVADGTATVTITAAATGFSNVTTTLTVTDNEVAALTVTANQTTVSESAGATAVTYTVVRNTADITQPLTVTLLSGTPTRLTVPATVIIPANAASVTFAGAAIENTIVDGTASVTVTTSATGFTSGTATVAVTDNENAVLSVTSASATVSEASGTLAGTVTTSVVSSAPILVSLSYETSNILTGPASVTIPAGAASVPVTFTIVSGSVQDQNLVARIEATAPGAATGVAQVTVTDADSMALTAIATADDSVQSNGTIITRNSVTQVTGTTTAGATITVDSDGNGVFDNGTATAGVDGSYTVDVTLLHTATNHGENRLVVKAISGANSADTAVRAHMAIGTVVHFATNLGSYDVELLDTEAPLTVANFLSYVESGAYQNMFAHRTNAGSAKFVQGGGFKVSNGQISSVVTTSPVQNEFNAANSNVSGTLSMALLGGGQFNSGTSQWFVNTSDNGAGFDPGKYTVFGRVIGDGVTVATQISNLPNVHPQLNTLYNSTALSEAPLSAFNPANTPVTGTVAITANSAVITGTNTLFTTELAVGQSIVIGSGRAYFVASIESNTSLTLTTTAPSTAANLAVTKDVVPDDADFVVFSTIGKILDTI